jgi:hypothetical protein
MVSETDAVVNPWTVVIHLQYACAADATMMTPVRLELRAPLAMAAISRPLRLLRLSEWACTRSDDADVLNRGHILPINVRNRSWMCQDALHVADHEHQCRAVEQNGLTKALLKCWPTM